MKLLRRSMKSKLLRSMPKLFRSARNGNASKPSSTSDRNKRPPSWFSLMLCSELPSPLLLSRSSRCVLQYSVGSSASSISNAAKSAKPLTPVLLLSRIRSVNDVGGIGTVGGCSTAISALEDRCSAKNIVARDSTSNPLTGLVDVREAFIIAAGNNGNSKKRVLPKPFPLDLIPIRPWCKLMTFRDIHSPNPVPPPPRRSLISN
mmetsp:Transcript_32838/g.47415  ORF Transcript_32838/g.47415 Transcript_32838/m.47415 type:complete len:204 (-) Transcript_32838:1638-2249(-)